MLSLNIYHLYPDAMNLYGDLGNILTLYRRATWRGIKTQIVDVKRGDDINFSDADIVFLGGGQDRGQKLIAEDLKQKSGSLKEESEKGLVALTICGGYQLFGKYFKTSTGEEIKGIDVLDCYTIAGSKRCIGNEVVDITNLAAKWATEDRIHESNIGLTTLVGFENHSGLTYLSGDTRPLGNVIIGFGNTGDRAFEGAFYKNIYGTYLHGPVLPKNPHFADHLILSALRRRYDDSIVLSKLDDADEKTAHYAAIERAKKAKTAYL